VSPVYRFPDQLGGGEYEVVSVNDHRMTMGFEVPGVGFVVLPMQAVGKVEPPLPPEPATGAYRVGGVLCMRVSSEPGKCWVYRTEQGLFDEATFADLCSNFGLDVVPLVSDPFAEPVTLPWMRETSYGAKVGVRPLESGSVNAWTQRPEGDLDDVVVATLAPDLTRDLARALWAAADAVEAQR
jgi:hypothetical protein